MQILTKLEIKSFTKELVVRHLKDYSVQLVTGKAFKNGFISSFNEAVHQAPECILTEEEYDLYVFEAHGLANHG